MAALLAVCLLAGAAPQAQATPVLQGSTLWNAGFHAGCMDSYCAQFVLAGCPAAMALPNGATVSITDVSSLGGQRLTFAWSDASMRVYDAGVPSAPVSRIYFYFVSGCTVASPASLPLAWAFALTTLPSERSQAYTVPRGSTWLIAVPMDNAAAVTWTAA